MINVLSVKLSLMSQHIKLISKKDNVRPYFSFNFITKSNQNQLWEVHSSQSEVKYGFSVSVDTNNVKQENNFKDNRITFSFSAPCHCFFFVQPS